MSPIEWKRGSGWFFKINIWRLRRGRKKENRDAHVISERHFSSWDDLWPFRLTSTVKNIRSRRWRRRRLLGNSFGRRRRNLLRLFLLWFEFCRVSIFLCEVGNLYVCVCVSDRLAIDGLVEQTNKKDSPNENLSHIYWLEWWKRGGKRAAFGLLLLFRLSISRSSLHSDWGPSRQMTGNIKSSSWKIFFSLLPIFLSFQNTWQFHSYSVKED